MNVIDYVILGVIGVSLLFGLYRGFIASVLNTGGGLISLFAAYKLSPQLVSLLQGNTALQDLLGNYTDMSSRLGDLDLALTSVQDLVRQGGDKIAEVVQRVNLPEPFSTLLQSNLVNQVFSGSANVTTVQDYISQTILNACLSIICFVLCFLVCYLVLSIVVSLVRAVFRFPVLKQLDGLAGGAFGLLRGILFCYVLMAAVPMVQTMIQVDAVTDLINGSTLAPLFTGSNLILSIMNGHL